MIQRKHIWGDEDAFLILVKFYEKLQWNRTSSIEVLLVE